MLRIREDKPSYRTKLPKSPNRTSRRMSPVLGLRISYIHRLVRGYLITFLMVKEAGPTFSAEPPHKVEFTNTAGTLINCIAHGNPLPSIDWLDKENNPTTSVLRVRHILANGSIYFPQFEAVEFRQDIHWSTYRCVASNSVGTILSRDVVIKAVINQRYEPEVQNPGGFVGSNVLIKCNLPPFAKDYVAVTSWLQEPNFNIFPSLEGDGKNHMLPTGELLVINITRLDAQKIYRCRTHHRLTQDAMISSNVGKIQLTEMRELVPPIMNEKVIIHTIRLGDPVVVACVAYANPAPIYKWHKKHTNGEDTMEKLLSTGHIKIQDGTLIIASASQGDSGSYFCTATNSEGSETFELQVLIFAQLTSNIQPSIQTVNLGKSADLFCRYTGFPMQNIIWLKDGQPLRSGSRVRLLSKEQIRITSITKEDKGMYQCFVKNDYDSTQSTAELRLGEVSPQIIYKFIEQTMQPGPSVSLKCSATGNPTPRILWQLDGFPLPNNERLMIGQYVTIFGDVISHVNISAVKSEDSGEYECKATSKAGETSHSARLNIYGMPYVRPMQQILTVAGKSFFFKCPVAGYPIDSITIEKVPPKITPFSFARDLNVGDRTSVQCVIGTGDLPLTFTWLKDGIDLLPNGTANFTRSKAEYKNDGRRIISQENTSDKFFYGDIDDNESSTLDGIITIRQNDDFTSALSITSVTRTQSGTYTCRVQNDAAVVIHSAQLKVNVPPRISPFSFEEEITEGMRTQLMCSSSQGDQPFNITWLKDHVPIQTNAGDLNSGGDNLSQDLLLTVNEYAAFSSILSIQNVSSTHNGNYTCRITNQAGSVEYTAVLSVAEPPRWIIKPTDQDAVLGNTVTIACTADGFPKPTILWKQLIDGQSGEYRELSYTGVNSITESHKNGTLILSKVTREHEGSYLCQANNGIGAGLSTLIKLTVHLGPQVTVRNKQLTVRRGDRVTLECEVIGDQPLDIYWRAKGNRIDPVYDVRYTVKNAPLSRGIISELSILQVVLADRGEYECMAGNTYGQDKAVMQVLVQEPPNFPINLHVVELGSREITLAWTPNEQNQSNRYSESQPVLNYILQYKRAQEIWHEHNNQKLLPGDKTVVHVTSLKPSQAYHFRLYAKNHLGTSAPSDILLVQTDVEIPSGRPQAVVVEPLGPQQLLITWRPPERDSWNGELLGYTIGYQKYDDATYNYTKVGILAGEGLNDFRLTGLDKYTQYAVTVSAFNIKGDGPQSEPVLSHTLEDVPSSPPQSVTCIALTAQNIQISWLSPPKENSHGVIQGYKVIYEPFNEESEYGNRETKITSSLNTVLHGLQPFTNYSVQVLAFTRAGEGVISPIVSCITEEAVPDPPERIKSVVSSESSVIISWLPPRRPNGIVTKYNVYIRILDKGQELKILKEILPAHNRHFEAKELTTRETYESWVTASTRIGQGPSTPVIKLTPSSSIPAAIISFGQTLSVSWKLDIKLVCQFVGSPRANIEWKVVNSRSKKQFHLEVGNDNVLAIRNIQRTHEGNYSCTVRNAIGSDHIIYQIFVQVPPTAPNLSITEKTSNSVSLQWRVDDIGGAPLKGFTLAYRKKFDEWKEVQLDRRVKSYLLENLLCGTQYQFSIKTYNKIGPGAVSNIETVKTRGNKPTPPQRHQLIRPNTTSALLELSTWQDGGCPILYFTIEFRKHALSSNWIIVSSSLENQARYAIGDLEPGTPYSIRITAHNQAGSSVSEYIFSTLHLKTTIVNNKDDSTPPEVKTLFHSALFLAVIATSIFGTILALLGACIFFRHYPRQVLNHDVDIIRPQLSDEKNTNAERHLDHIPEFSEDIYPYATFHLPDHESQSGNINRKNMTYDSQEGESLTSAKIKRSMSGMNSSNLCASTTGNVDVVNCNTVIAMDVGNLAEREKCHMRMSNTPKSESEEYDSLNSDSDISTEKASSIDTNRLQDETGGANYTLHGHNPIPRKERIPVLNHNSLHTTAWTCPSAVDSLSRRQNNNHGIQVHIPITSSDVTATTVLKNSAVIHQFPHQQPATQICAIYPLPKFIKLNHPNYVQHILPNRIHNSKF